MSVYTVAICEDERATCMEVCRMCDDILTQADIPHRIRAFSSATELDACLRSGKASFDLLVLDIAMQGKSGMELARELRQRKDRVSIIFVTGCEEYLEEGYEVQPVHFLLKPVNRTRLEKALLTDWELNHAPRSITLQSGNHSLRLSLPDILYVETAPKHNVRIATVGKAHLSPASLASIEQALPADHFVRCHKSYLVNLDHIAQMGASTMTLDTEEEVPPRAQVRKGLPGRVHRLSQPIGPGSDPPASDRSPDWSPSAPSPSARAMPSGSCRATCTTNTPSSVCRTVRPPP